MLSSVRSKKLSANVKEICPSVDCPTCGHVCSVPLGQLYRAVTDGWGAVAVAFAFTSGCVIIGRPLMIGLTAYNDELAGLTPRTTARMRPFSSGSIVTLDAGDEEKSV